MNSLPFYRETEADGRKFVLVHGELGNFSPDKELRNYRRDELVWSRPELDEVYFPNRPFAVGHTPTQMMYDKARHLTAKVEFYRTDSFVDIYCGYVFRGGKPGCLRLDTLEEIYVRKSRPFGRRWKELIKMSAGTYAQNGVENRPQKEVFAVYITNGMLYDRLNRLAAEYSMPVEVLTELAVKRLVDDVELFRALRKGRIGGG